MHRRVSLSGEPLPQNLQYSFMNPAWPAKWVGPVDFAFGESEALVFRCAVNVKTGKKYRVHLSADQKYELYVDGEYVGRGVERGDLKNWVYESYDLDLKAGKHLVVVKVWWVSPDAPAAEAQQTHRPALLVYGEKDGNELISTGVAKWEMARMPGYVFADHDRLASYFATGAQLKIDGRKTDAELEAGRGSGWKEAAAVGRPYLGSLRWESTPWWVLRPAFLPAMYEKTVRPGVVRHVEAVKNDVTHALPVMAVANLANEQEGWSKLVRKGGRLVVPANTIRRVIIDLEDYYCAYPELRCSGEGAFVRFQTAESLYHVQPGQEKQSRNSKGNRNEIEGKCFFGVGFEFTAGKKAFAYRPHAFVAGRYVELLIKTGKNPLVIEGFDWLETHFPFKFQAEFASSDAAHAEIIPVALRTLEMCSHDTSMDCPYYERLNYVGDTRLQSLIAYVAADEGRLAEKCITMFDVSRRADGFTSSRYPTRTMQTIPTFSLWWVCMVHDYAMWRDKPAFVSGCMPGVRAVLEGWRRQLRDNGMLLSPEGWNFVDWVPAWRSGIPASGEPSAGYSSIINMQAVYTLRRAAELEELAGEPALAQRNRDLAETIAKQVVKAFWNKEKGLFADDAQQQRYSEHAQCMAVLSGIVEGKKAAALVAAMLKAEGLAQATIYFSHYLFETFGAVGRIDALQKRLELWESLKANGFCTTFESPEPSRSDCHAWGAHPVYHFLATIAGIRPGGFGFEEVVVRPQLGTLQTVEGKMPHRLGQIGFALRQEEGKVKGEVTLPEGLSGRVEVNGKVQKLKGGRNVVR